MRGITPIIAIVLMLLIAVAAAAGAFFFIQAFRGRAEQETGGSFSAIQSQTQSQIVVESAWMEENGIGVRVKNVGQTALDCTKFTAFVDKIPYIINTTNVEGALPAACGGGASMNSTGCTSSLAVGDSAVVRLTDNNIDCGNTDYRVKTSSEIMINTEGGATALFSINPAKKCCT